MITFIYRAITVAIAVLTAVCLFKEEKLRLQLNNAIVLIPLILRALMIK